MEITETQRGFAVASFKDVYNHSCSVQKSSAAMYDAIWLGIDDAEPKVMASSVKDLPSCVREKIGAHDGTGWVPYPLPEGISLTTRMHLTRGQVADLLPILQRFVDTGALG